MSSYVDIFAVKRVCERMACFPPGRVLASAMMLFANTVFSCSVPFAVKVGPGSVCDHRGLGVVIHPQAVIGSGVRIYTGVVIGGAGKGKAGVPVLGDNVLVGSGAKILGAIHVGEGAVIGANAVVLSDVPPGGVAVGVPATIRIDTQ